MKQIDMTKFMPFYDKIEETCVAAFRAPEQPEAFGLLQTLMDLPGLPMHCPPHHFIVPAVLLTAVGRAEEIPEDLYLAQLAEARERAMHVLGGFCGWYGSCGAAVGIGIFMSVFTDTDPHSNTNWAACNGATGHALLKISEIEGPRCCKRNCFLSLLSALDTLERELDIRLDRPERVICKYHDANAECKKQACPFYPGEE